MTEKNSVPETPSWKLPPHERKKVFFNYKIRHPHLAEAFHSIMQLVNSPDCGRLGIGVGPTGAGKTTLLNSAQIKIEQELAKQLVEDKERIPSVIVTACPPESGAFSWKVLYLRTLDACREVAAKEKVPLDLLDGRPLYRQISSSESVAALRESVCEVLRRRRPRALFIDEAQHILKAGSGSRLQDQLDVLKTLADECQVPIILFGTYDLLIQHTLNGQLARRSMPIHFRRYRMTVQSEMEGFAQVALSFCNAMPFEKKPDFLQDIEFLMERSLGCVGILKEALVRAVNLVIDENAKTITIDHVRKTVLDAKKCEAILQEILDGEQLFEEEIAVVRRLRLKLGIDTSEQPVRASIRKSPKLKPGMRKPSRDKIGFNP